MKSYAVELNVSKMYRFGEVLLRRSPALIALAAKIEIQIEE